MKAYKELGNIYLKHRKKRGLLVIVSMFLATVFIYTVVTFLLNYYFNSRESWEERYNYHCQIYKATDEQKEKINNYVTVENADYAFSEYCNFEDYYGYEIIELCHLENTDQTTFNYTMIEGKEPVDSSEIILDEACLHLFYEDVKVGSTVSVMVFKEDQEEPVKNTYKVSGIFKRETKTPVYQDMYSAFTIAEREMPLDAYVRFDSMMDWKGHTETLVNDIGIVDRGQTIYTINVEYATYYGQNELTLSIVAMVLMLLVLIVYICMVMVRSLFTSNIMDKVHDFNILKALGANNKQIKQIFKREIYVEGIIAFSLGVLFSHVSMYIIKRAAQLYNFNFEFNFAAFLVSVFFMYITISLAIIEPFGIMKKVTIVDGIGQNYAITNKKIKKRGGRLFRIFGIEGEYAYKNIRRNNKSFVNAIAAFSISVLLITTLGTVFMNIRRSFDVTTGNGKAETEIVYDIYVSADYHLQSSDYIKEKYNILKKEPYITDVDMVIDFTSVCKSKEHWLKITEEAQQWIYDSKESFEVIYIPSDCLNIVFYNEKQLNMLNKYMLDGADAVEATKDGGAILVNTAFRFDSKKEEYESCKMYDINVGDTINITDIEIVAEEMSKGNDIVDIFKYLKEEDKYKDVTINAMCTRSLHSVNNATIILSYDYYNELCGENKLDLLCTGFYINIDESLYNKEQFEEVCFKQVKALEWFYFDEYKTINESTKVFKIVVLVLVVFIFIMGVISVLHNMISEQQVRRKEISILRSIGMSKKKMNKMLMLEKVIIAVLAWLVGTVLGVAFSSVILIGILYYAGMKFVFAWGIYAVTLVVLVCVMLLMSLIMVTGMGKMNITESIRNNE